MVIFRKREFRSASSDRLSRYAGESKIEVREIEMKNIFEKDEFTAACSPFASGGYMGQTPMDESAARGFEQYSNNFGKYLSDKDGGRKYSEEEKLMRERAKKANRIYKQVCEELQMNACFFSNFGEWSEYIEGRLSDAEFEGLAITRAQQMMADEN
jgi:hypothetical protein